MKTLKRTILSPVLLLVILVPIVTLLIFNLSMRIYVQRTFRSELNAASLLIEKLAKQELGDIKNLPDSSRLEEAAEKIMQKIRNPKVLSSTDILFYLGDKPIYPVNGDSMDSVLLRRIAEKIRSSGAARTVSGIVAGREKYFLVSIPLADKSGEELTLVLLSQTAAADALIRSVNLILIVIMLVGILISVWLADRFTARVTDQIRQLSLASERIGNGDFSQKPLNESKITELDLLSQSIDRMSERLRATDAQQRTFLQNASHELRTPLMSIQGYAEGIASGVLPDAKKASEVIMEESARLNTLVDELLTLSRIESQSFAQKTELLNLRNLLPEYAQRLGGLAVGQNKKIKLNLPEEDVFMTGDEALLAQAITNIVSNCLRYARTETSITLLRQKESAVIRISDDGPGIPAEDLPYIFERFYKGKNGCFGLGLSIAKSAAGLLHGTINVRNINGAVFELAFPFVRR